MMKLHFSEYDFEKIGYQTPPGPSLNGGLYTGEPFVKNAPYGNIAITPDATVYINNNLARGNQPPPSAKYQYPATRQGNSFVEWKGIKHSHGNIYCAPCTPSALICSCDEICPNEQTRRCNLANCRKQQAANADGLNKLFFV
jgi:hypothetical protein